MRGSALPALVPRRRPAACSCGRATLPSVSCGGFTGAHQFDSDISDGRYPRCAPALTADSVLAVACDGRHGDDAGLTPGELAAALAGVGARSALNLDGGGSASLVCRGRLVNRPHEQHAIELLDGRPIATALVFDLRS